MENVAVIAHWDPPSSLRGPRAQKKLFVHLSHTLKAFGIKDVCLVDVDSLEPEFGDAEINLKVVETLDEALALYPTMEPVYVEQGGEALDKFHHPGQAVYILGSDFNGLPKADVSVPTEIGLYADVALGIVLYDRRLKWPSP